MFPDITMCPQGCPQLKIILLALFKASSIGLKIETMECGWDDPPKLGAPTPPPQKKSPLTSNALGRRRARYTCTGGDDLGCQGGRETGREEVEDTAKEIRDSFPTLGYVRSR